MLTPSPNPNAKGGENLSARAFSPSADARASHDAECAFAQANLSAYLDSEVAPHDHNRIANHLADCPKCAATLKEYVAVDELIEGEWSLEASLPSPCEMQIALDSIMDALPASSEPPVTKRTAHTSLSWVRFSTSVTGLILIMGLLWSSYQFGYANGVSHGRSQSNPPADSNPLLPQPTSNLSSNPILQTKPPNPLPSHTKSSLKTI
jgi:hypothetical protein